MKLILISIMTISLIIMMMFFLTSLTKKCFLNLNKSSPFECGFNPMSHKRLPFSIHFFLTAIIFLIFDIEIIIILPSITMIKMVMLKYWIMSCCMFVIILILGLYYEWWNGLLTWQK